ncbi:hypothetical protein V2W45_1242009, partial [Cenococcum geophilum]
KRLRGYLEEEQKELKALVWPYLKSATVEDLNINRQALLDKLSAKDKIYLQTYYIRIKKQLITYYIK